MLKKYPQNTLLRSPNIQPYTVRTLYSYSIIICNYN